MAALIRRRILPLLSLSFNIEWCLHMSRALNWGTLHVFCKQSACAGEVYPNIRIMLYISEALLCMKCCMFLFDRPFGQARTPAASSTVTVRTRAGRSIWTIKTTPRDAAGAPDAPLSPEPPD